MKNGDVSLTAQQCEIPGTRGLFLAVKKPPSSTRQDAFCPDASALLPAMLSNLPDAIVFSDSQGRIVIANAVARAMSQSEPEGVSLLLAPSLWGEMYDLAGNYVPADSWPGIAALHGRPTTQQEFHLLRCDGTSCHVLVSASPMIAGAQIEGAMLTLTDVTDCKRREVIAREMSISRERGRMAAEIHDTFAQSLNAIVLQLEAAEEDFQGVSFDLAERRCRRACELARDGLRESRRTIWTLSDKPMGNGGLTDALSHMAQMLFHGTSVRVTVSLKPESPSPISDELQYELLRIGRESLTNVWKHANATAVHLEFTCRENEIRLSVCDDGRGFDASPFSVSDGGFGLIGMRVRAEGLGGNLVIESQPGRGTCVLVVVPLQLAEERRIA